MTAYKGVRRALDWAVGAFVSVISGPICACLDMVLPRAVDLLCDVAIIPILRLLEGVLLHVPVVSPSLVKAFDYLFERVSDLFPVSAGSNRTCCWEEEEEEGGGNVDMT